MKVFAEPIDKEIERGQPWQQPSSMKVFIMFLSSGFYMFYLCTKSENAVISSDS